MLLSSESHSSSDHPLPFPQTKTSMLNWRDLICATCSNHLSTYNKPLIAVPCGISFYSSLWSLSNFLFIAARLKRWAHSLLDRIAKEELYTWWSINPLSLVSSCSIKSIAWAASFYYVLLLQNNIVVIHTAPADHSSTDDMGLGKTWTMVQDLQFHIAH